MQDELGMAVIAAPIWLTFAVTAGLYLYYAGRITRHLKQHHGKAWDRLTRPPRRFREFPRNTVYPFLELVWTCHRFRDPELARLADTTRGLALAAGFTMLASLATVYLFD